ncbi:MAG: hypothetical protein AAFQ09_10990 [Pseudomonadota bacterium]
MVGNLQRDTTLVGLANWPIVWTMKRFAIIMALNPTFVTAQEIIVTRGEKSIGLYVRMPYNDVPSFFGAEVQGFADADGTLATDALFNGTFEQADALITYLSFAVGSENVAFEALSMMVHPPNSDLTFDTPLDAEIAIAVCGVPLPDGPIVDADLTWVAGWYAYPIDPEQDLTISFPATGRMTEVVEVTSFDGDTRLDTSNVTLADGGSLTLPYVGSRRWFSWLR